MEIETRWSEKEDRMKWKDLGVTKVSNGELCKKGSYSWINTEDV